MKTKTTTRKPAILKTLKALIAKEAGTNAAIRLEAMILAPLGDTPYTLVRVEKDAIVLGYGDEAQERWLDVEQAGLGRAMYLVNYKGKYYR